MVPRDAVGLLEKNKSVAPAGNGTIRRSPSLWSGYPGCWWTYTRFGYKITGLMLEHFVFKK